MPRNPVFLSRRDILFVLITGDPLRAAAFQRMDNGGAPCRREPMSDEPVPIFFHQESGNRLISLLLPLYFS